MERKRRECLFSLCAPCLRRRCGHLFCLKACWSDSGQVFTITIKPFTMIILVFRCVIIVFTINRLSPEFGDEA